MEKLQMVGYRFVPVFVTMLLLIVASSFPSNVIYVEDTSNFPNPDRGFFIQTDVTANALQNARRDNAITLDRVYYRLDNYVDADLPQSLLDKIASDCVVLRQCGAKMIPRFAYNFGECHDASLSRILSHLEQLGPVLRANSDVIAFIEAGFIGRWGEWHHWQCDDPYSQENTATRQAVLFKLLDAVPDRMVALRYNLRKREIFGTDLPLVPDSAFCGSRRARTGAHNDCFRADETDAGTYTGNRIEWEKNYLSQDNRFVPQGGESCGTSNLSTCDSSVKDLRRMHWDAINSDYQGDVLNSWKSGGCMPDIRKLLGYRIKMSSALLQDSVRPGALFSGTVSLTNIGWGKIYNYYGCELVFREKTTKNAFRVKLSQDPRRWCMSDSVVSVALSAPIPATTPAGTYGVFLNLPDTSNRLRGRPEYAIRFANKNVWEDSTGFNSLQHTVLFSPTVATVDRVGVSESRPRLSVTFDRSRSSLLFTFQQLRTTAGVAVYSLDGKRIFLSNGIRTPHYAWPITGISNGMIIVAVSADGNSLMQRFIVAPR
jgi:hypothetical protein